jgi:gamma-glutamylputrescine oxidase
LTLPPSESGCLVAPEPRAARLSPERGRARKRTQAAARRVYDRGLSVPFWLDGPATEYGPLPGDESVDVAIVGAGVTGLACARVLAAAGRRVRVLDARRAGWGASGRNGGFALRGTAAPYDRARLPELMRLTEAALGRIRELAGDAFRPVGSLRVAVDADELNALRAEQNALAEDGFPVEWRDRSDVPPALRGRALGALFHPPDGALDQGRWVRRLAALAAEAGTRIAEETPVVALEGTTVTTARGTVSAEAVVIATDGYTEGLVPELDAAIAPARGQVLATARIAERLFSFPVYARWGYDYLQQLPDGTLVAGGRRDVDLDAEATREEGTSATVQGAIESLVRELLGRVPEVTHRWSGLMGFTPDYLPLVGPLPGRDGVWVSAGYSGHGNVLGFTCGELVAEAILGRADERVGALSPERIPAARPPA